MSARKVVITCSSCGGQDLEFVGWVEVGLACSISQALSAIPQPASLEVQGVSFDPEEVFLMCAACKHETGVICRSEAGFEVRLDALQVREFLRRTLNSESFRWDGWQAELVWKPSLEALLVAEHPELGRT